MSSCVFCRIVEGDLPSHKIEDAEGLFAILDAFPLARGHTLIIPKTHATLLEDLPQETAASMGTALQRLVPAVRKAVDAAGATVALHDGKAAGQEVPHVHWHIVPRFSGDGAGPIHALFHRRPQLSEQDKMRITRAIRKAAGTEA